MIRSTRYTRHARLRPTASAATAARGGFTLIELLVVMTVLLILSSMILFAMFGAQERAREARTRSTINKIDSVIMPMYDDYQTRRVPIVTAGLQPREGAYMRLQALRELMKIEMPDRFTDMTNDPRILQRRTSLAAQLKRRLDQVGDRRTTQYQGAECLYLLATLSTSEGAGRERFSEQEVGDKDNDGMKEFLDGWGRPISFIRWPAGFNSPLQPFREGFSTGDDWGQVPHHDWETSHDPFDARKLEREAYAIYPLIYSAGGDGVADIKAFVQENAETDPFPITTGQFDQDSIDPYLSNDEDGPLGRQRDNKNDGKDWFDNIHNHQNRAELR